MTANIVKKNLKLNRKKILNLKAFDVIHGMITATGYLFQKNCIYK